MICLFSFSIDFHSSLTSAQNNFVASQYSTAGLVEKFFIISDLVKFAKQIPSENENLYAISTIRELIQKERNDIETQILAEK